jgi:hypothetical protein
MSGARRDRWQRPSLLPELMKIASFNINNINLR